jgi:hypothetical protein
MKDVMLTQRDLVAGGAAVGVGVLGWRLCGRLLEARHRTFPVVQRTTACHVDGVTCVGMWAREPRADAARRCRDARFMVNSRPSQCAFLMQFSSGRNSAAVAVTVGR